MEFMHVFRVSHHFALANGGTIATYGSGQEKFKVQSRTTRTEILVERESDQPAVWRTVQTQDAAGEKTLAKETFTTEHGLIQCLFGFWQAELDPQPFAQVLESSLSPVTK